jgi:hypothetical protein
MPSAFTERFGVEHPLGQAVSNAGAALVRT